MPTRFRTPNIKNFARTRPFACAAENRSRLAGFISPLSPSRVDHRAVGFHREDRSADTHKLLVDMTQSIRRAFRHIARHEKGIQDPVRTLQLGSGSGRDMALLMIEALRSLGIAARFVSEYVHLADDDDDDESMIGGNTHTWVQVYVRGRGWVDFDPSSGMIGNQNLVRVAVVHEPRAAIPLQGTWIGAASDHLAMKVGVKIVGGVSGTLLRPYA